MIGALGAASARRLAARRPLRIDATRGAAVKRNLHEVVVAADADAFARAFAEVMREPGLDFGGIRIKRPAARVGQPFVPGDRFHGCLSLELALAARDLRMPRVLGRLATWIEDRATSDYAEVIALGERGASYRYLAGTPMAGQSSFTVTPLGPGRCRFSALFEYQEQSGLGISLLHRFGHRFHDRVVAAQVAAAAARLGARVLTSTIPAAYSG